MIGDRQKKMNINKLKTVTVFYNLIEIERRAEKIIKSNNSLWGIHWLKNRVREFLFKFFNNKLGLNTRVSHFVEDFDRSCDLCKASKTLPACEESFTHLFIFLLYNVQLLRKCSRNL